MTTNPNVASATDEEMEIIRRGIASAKKNGFQSLPCSVDEYARILARLDAAESSLAEAVGLIQKLLVGYEEQLNPPTKFGDEVRAFLDRVKEE